LWSESKVPQHDVPSDTLTVLVDASVWLSSPHRGHADRSEGADERRERGCDEIQCKPTTGLEEWYRRKSSDTDAETHDAEYPVVPCRILQFGECACNRFIRSCTTIANTRRRRFCEQSKAKSCGNQPDSPTSEDARRERRDAEQAESCTNEGHREGAPDGLSDVTTEEGPV
jgi:hypothetical protein